MTENTPGSVHRRTVVAGAAWTVPVVALATATPAAAASPTGKPMLAFTNGPYSIAACGTLKDVVIKATTDGTTAVPPGTPITVTLPSGLTWSDGKTDPRSLPTDGNGEIVLSGLKATSASGTRTLTASTGVTLAANAPVEVTSGATAFEYNSNGGNGPVPAIPVGSTAVGFRTYLTSNGDLYYGGTRIATGVNSAATEIYPGNSVAYVSYTTNAGGFEYNSNGGNGQLPAIPAGSTATGFRTYLAPNGDLYYGGTRIATGVNSAATEIHPGNDVAYVSYTTNTGGFEYNSNGGNGQLPAIPAGSTAVGFRTYLAPNGDLYYGGTRIATGVNTAATEIHPGNDVAYVSYTTNTGGFEYNSNGDNGQLPAIPAGSTATGFRTYLAPNGDLYYGGTRIATGVNTAATEIHPGNTVAYVSYTSQAAC